MVDAVKKIATPALTKMPTGIDGFDEITGGGLPRNRTSIITGDAGSGKTVFALQTLVNGAQRWNVPGIFVAFEENSRDILTNAASFGWDIEALRNDRKLFFLDAYMSPGVIHAGDFELTGMLASIKAKADEMGAGQIVFDSIDVLLRLLNDNFTERRECYRLRDWLAETGLTGILTVRSGADDAPPKISASGDLTRFMGFMADCVISLRRTLLDTVSLRELHVVKYRGGHFDENEFPMIINSDGIDVTSYGTDRAPMQLPVDRMPSGIPDLDELLAGGYFRGNSVLITGAPGSAKSTLAGAFAQAACLRGERTLYVSFDQKADALAQSLTSVGIRLNPHIESGTLLMYSPRTPVRRMEEHLVRLKTLIQRHKTRCLVIDPISASFRIGGRLAGVTVAEQLLHYAWLQGITVVFTSLSRAGEPLTEESVAQVSSMVDTWIHLSYLVKGGAYARSLAVIKSRGTRHDNLPHEVILSDAGVTIREAHAVTANRY